MSALATLYEDPSTQLFRTNIRGAGLGKRRPNSSLSQGSFRVRHPNVGRSATTQYATSSYIKACTGEAGIVGAFANASYVALASGYTANSYITIGTGESGFVGTVANSTYAATGSGYTSSFAIGTSTELGVSNQTPSTLIYNKFEGSPGHILDGMWTTATTGDIDYSFEMPEEVIVPSVTMGLTHDTAFYVSASGAWASLADQKVQLDAVTMLHISVEDTLRKWSEDTLFDWQGHLPSSAGLDEAIANVIYLNEFSQNLLQPVIQEWSAQLPTNLIDPLFLGFGNGLAPIGSIFHSPLATTIRQQYDALVPSLDSDALHVARSSVDQATFFVDTYLPNEAPLVMLMDDGQLALQWRGVNAGVLLIFSGDETGNCSIKTEGGSYATNGKDFELAQGLPADALAAIESIGQTN